LIFFCGNTLQAAEPFISKHRSNDMLVLKEKSSSLSFLCNESTDKGILRAVYNLQKDFASVTGEAPLLVNALSVSPSMVVIIGSFGEDSVIDDLVKQKKLNATDVKNKREKYIIQSVSDYKGFDHVIVIAGSDKRGTIYGIYEFSKQIGVSPWHYWADVPVEKSDNLYFKKGKYTDNEPAVEYRGIFLNDEEPSLGTWARTTFGGINSKFYEKVFELVLRLKGNYIWPAMWGKAFYDDDPQNGILADEMGIIMGTSHHEPMALAQTDWHRYIKRNNLPNIWDYKKNEPVLKEFWKLGIERSKNWEKLVTIGMRGDGDEAMGDATNITLLENIVKDQRKIIKQVTGKNPNQTPQVWALYKEVQDYYDEGMRVPDDVILLFCDDNWGNVRKLPDLTKPLHKGGYGMYYHFDYVGAPRNSKWINISPIQRVWEQMNLSYEHGVDKVWIVNVGDLKPMEFPISFFLDMAWNPKQFNADNLLEYTEKWAAQQFGETYAKEIAEIINLYSKYNRRVTPETLDWKTYSLENYNEFESVLNDYRTLALEANRLYGQIPSQYRDAYYQLVLYPVDACSNLYELYYNVAKNHQLGDLKDISANYYAEKAKKAFQRNAYFNTKYNQEISNGKWNHMMDQMKIGYKSWNDSKEDVMPYLQYVDPKDAIQKTVFTEKEGYISIEAEHFARKNNSERIEWKVIPGFGKTLSGVTTFPQNEYPQKDENLFLEYDIELNSSGTCEIELLLAPTLNFNSNKGLRYEISLIGERPQVVNFNGHYKGELGKWQSEHIIRSITKHEIGKAGKNTIRIRVLEPGIILEKILINTGGLKKSYLGPEESK